PNASPRAASLSWSPSGPARRKKTDRLSLPRLVPPARGPAEPSPSRDRPAGPLQRGKVEPAQRPRRAEARAHLGDAGEDSDAQRVRSLRRLSARSPRLRVRPRLPHRTGRVPGISGGDAP